MWKWLQIRFHCKCWRSKYSKTNSLQLCDWQVFSVKSSLYKRAQAVSLHFNKIFKTFSDMRNRLVPRISVLLPNWTMVLMRCFCICPNKWCPNMTTKWKTHLILEIAFEGTVVVVEYQLSTILNFYSPRNPDVVLEVQIFKKEFQMLRPNDTSLWPRLLHYRFLNNYRQIQYCLLWFIFLCFSNSEQYIDVFYVLTIPSPKYFYLLQWMNCIDQCFHGFWIHIGINAMS